MAARHARSSHRRARVRRRRTRLVVVALASFLLLPVTVASVQAADPVFVNTSSELPALSTSYDPASADDCIAGRTRCIDKMIRNFGKRFEPLAKSCSHNAPFAMMYLRVSQTYRWSLDHPELYRYKNPGWMNHVVAVFATYYTAAVDNWAKGSRTLVPQPWVTAFSAADGKQVATTGNMLLGANAHINRDLAFSMAAAGLVDPAGVSGKHDYDIVNDLINTVIAPLNAEVRTRFDSTVDDSGGPAGATYTFTSQLTTDWREQAWRNAEALVNAKDEVQKSLVAAQIETYSATVAAQVKEGYAYKDPKREVKARDSYCAANYAKTGALPYAFGKAAAF